MRSENHWRRTAAVLRDEDDKMKTRRHRVREREREGAPPDNGPSAESGLMLTLWAHGLWTPYTDFGSNFSAGFVTRPTLSRPM